MTGTILKYTESYKMWLLEMSKISKETLVIEEEQNPT